MQLIVIGVGFLIIAAILQYYEQSLYNKFLKLHSMIENHLTVKELMEFVRLLFY